MYSTLKTPKTKSCEWCGAEFVPNKFKGNNHRFCCEQCQVSSHNASRDESITYTCKQCGQEFHPKVPNRKTFCGRPCSIAWHKEHGSAAKPKRTEPRPEKPERPKRHCQICGVELPNGAMRTCKSSECRAELGRRYYTEKHNANIQPIRCKVCRKTFTPVYGDKKRAVCSEECQRVNARRNSRKSRNIRGGTLNAVMRKRLRIMHGNEWRQWYEPINKKRVYERDKYRCKLCGCKVIVGGAWQKKQATIDHIVPVSLGGEHKYANVQTACMECNTRKGATIQGQQRLFG